MKKNGWLRLTLFLSFAWVVGVSSLAMYETLKWDNWDDKKGQFFYHYYFATREAPSPDADAKEMEYWNQFLRAHPNYPDERMPEDKRVFLIKEFTGTLFLPLVVLWVLYGFLYYGGRWVWAGFKDK